jgi:hypothetical protein
MASRNYYEVLQVAPGAEPEVVEATYRRLALKYHPDRNPDPAAAVKMSELNAAYETLRDPERRRTYDEHLSPGRGESGSAASGAAVGPQAPASAGWEWLAPVAAVVVVGVWQGCARDGGPETAGPPVVTGITRSWDGGLFTHDFLVTNQSPSDLHRVNVTLVLYRTDGQLVAVKQGWARWGRQETKRINVPAHTYTRQELVGFAQRGEHSVAIESRWTSTGP